MALKGYNSYRGRQGIWRGLLIAVLILTLIAACAFLFLQRFITYSDDGTFHLELPEIPFLEKILGEQNETPGPGQDVNLVIETPQKDNEEETKDEEPSAEIEETPQHHVPVVKPYSPLRLVGLPVLPQDEESLMAELESIGADGFVFTAKAVEGTVYFNSTVALPDAVSADAAGVDLLTRLCALKGIYTVAKINCFHDSLYAKANMEAAGICQSNGYIWYDYAEEHWLEPEKETARRYLINLALECAQLGFDELMLEDMNYPVHGKTYKIDYSKNTMEKTEALVQFITQLRAELEPYGVRLSLLLREEDVTGAAQDSDASGFAADKILPLVDAVYTVTEDPEVTESAMTALLGNVAAPVLIPVVADDTAVGGWYLPR